MSKIMWLYGLQICRLWSLLLYRNFLLHFYRKHVRFLHDDVRIKKYPYDCEIDEREDEFGKAMAKKNAKEKLMQELLAPEYRLKCEYAIHIIELKLDVWRFNFAQWRWISGHSSIISCAIKRILERKKVVRFRENSQNMQKRSLVWTDR